jgi:epoxyqueuosine reductase
MFYIIGMQQGKIESMIKDCARAQGFDLVGICSANSTELTGRLTEWLERNYHGEMKYMENPVRSHPAGAMQDVRTMIVVGLNYRWRDSDAREQEAMISKYTWGGDYHRIMKPMLESLASEISRLLPANQFRAYVDTGPIAEKHWAEKAGLGWTGKHTNILNQKGSSWFFLGVVMSDAELEPDQPAENHCGTCVHCIVACPTGAIV